MRPQDALETWAEQTARKVSISFAIPPFPRVGLLSLRNPYSVLSRNISLEAFALPEFSAIAVESDAAARFAKRASAGHRVAEFRTV